MKHLLLTVGAFGIALSAGYCGFLYNEIVEKKTNSRPVPNNMYTYAYAAIGAAVVSFGIALLFCPLGWAVFSALIAIGPCAFFAGTYYSKRDNLLTVAGDEGKQYLYYLMGLGGLSATLVGFAGIAPLISDEFRAQMCERRR